MIYTEKKKLRQVKRVFFACFFEIFQNTNQHLSDFSDSSQMLGRGAHPFFSGLKQLNPKKAIPPV